MAERLLCDNKDMVLEWSGGVHGTAHAQFGITDNIDAALYKVMASVGRKAKGMRNEIVLDATSTRLHRPTYIYAHHSSMETYLGCRGGVGAPTGRVQLP